MLRTVRRVVENIGPGVLLRNPKRNIAEDVIQAIQDVSYDLAEAGVLDVKDGRFTTAEGGDLSFLNAGLKKAEKSLANGRYQTAVSLALDGLLKESETGKIEWDNYRPYLEPILGNAEGVQMLRDIQLTNRVVRMRNPPEREEEPTAAAATGRTAVPDRDPEPEAEEDPSTFMAGIPVAGTGKGGMKCHACAFRQRLIQRRLADRAQCRQMAMKKHF